MDLSFALAGLSVGALFGTMGVGGSSVLTPPPRAGFGVPLAVAVGMDLGFAALLLLTGRAECVVRRTATTLRDAIVAHGGEGEIVRDRFLRLSPAEQAAAYRFLESL